MKVALNGAGVSEVRFSDIPSLKVAVTQTASPATPAATPTSTPEEQMVPAVAVAGAVVAAIAIGTALALQRKKWKNTFPHSLLIYFSTESLALQGGEEVRAESLVFQGG